MMSMDASRVSTPVVIGSPAFQQTASQTPSPPIPIPLSSLLQMPHPLFLTPPSSLLQTPSPIFPIPLSSTPVDAHGSATAVSASGSLNTMARCYSGIILRFLAVIFSFASSVALLVPAPRPHAAKGEQPFSFRRYPEFRYCLAAVISSTVYSSVQLLKSIHDKLSLKEKNATISEKTNDYLTFSLDQVMAYLLFSSSSIAVMGTIRISRTTFYTPAIISLVMSFAAFVAVATSALHSAYQLAKRIIW